MTSLAQLFGKLGGLSGIMAFANDPSKLVEVAIGIYPNGATALLAHLNITDIQNSELSAQDHARFSLLQARIMSEIFAALTAKRDIDDAVMSDLFAGFPVQKPTLAAFNATIEQLERGHRP